jgi:hypothetical protein
MWVLKSQRGALGCLGQSLKAFVVNLKGYTMVTLPAISVTAMCERMSNCNRQKDPLSIVIQL